MSTLRIRNAARKSIGLVLALQFPVAAVAQFPERPTGPVTDAAGILSPEAVARIDQRLTRLRDSTGGEVAVVTLSGIGDRAAADVALQIGRAWGVGGDYPIGDPRRNAGVVVLLVPRTPEHAGAIHIASGQGTEGFLTDAMAGRIADAMIPALREGDYDAALETGTTLLTDLIARELGATDPALLVERRRGPPIAGILAVIVIVVLLMIVAGAASARHHSQSGPFPPRRRRGNDWWSGGFGGGFGGFGGGGFGGGGFGGGGFGGGGFGGFGGGGGFSGGGAGRSF